MLPVAVLIALLGAVACSRSADRSSLDSLPQSVSDAVAALAAQCRAVDGIPHTDDTVRCGDFTKDGRDDFVLYAGWMACGNAASVFGDREKDVTVFTGDASGGASWAFGDSVYDVAIEDADGKLQLWFTVSLFGPPGESEISHNTLYTTDGSKLHFTTDEPMGAPMDLVYEKGVLSDGMGMVFEKK